MPSKNIIKEYLKGGVYHVYNRGVGKQDIFLNDHDYSTFLFYLKLYLDNPKNTKELDLYHKRKHTLRKNFYKTIDLLCYCLMPNHLHLLIKQKNEKDIIEFMKCLITTYSMYFNRKYDRVGHLFQGRYKAVLVDNDNYLLHLSRYIHLNPVLENPVEGQTLDKGKIQKITNYPYSSYLNYLGKKNTSWVKQEFILDYFEDNKKDILLDKNKTKFSYKNFVEDYIIDSEEIIGGFVLE